MLMMRTLLATVCCIFGSWGLVIELNFGSDFEHKVWSRFWSWSSGKIFELEFGQHFAAGNDICRVMKLNLGCDTLVSWTQPSGQLYLWQCCICIMLYNKDKKGYDGRLIWYSYLVLGTRSAAKFEKVPSTSLHRVIVRCHAQSTRGPCISSDTKMLRYFWCNTDYPQSNIQCTTYRFFFNWASPEFAKCWPVSN